MKQWCFSGSMYLGLIVMLILGCSDSSTNNPRNNGPTPDVYELPATLDTSIVIDIEAGKTVEITATDSVNTNPDGPVVDCDLWTDADGIADCNYVTGSPECRGLPFMALLGHRGTDYFLVGTSFDTTFSNAGQLELLINDWVFNDNAGKFRISVLVR